MLNVVDDSFAMRLGVINEANRVLKARESLKGLRGAVESFLEAEVEKHASVVSDAFDLACVRGEVGDAFMGKQVRHAVARREGGSRAGL